MASLRYRITHISNFNHYPDREIAVSELPTGTKEEMDNLCKLINNIANRHGDAERFYRAIPVNQELKDEYKELL